MSLLWHLAHLWDKEAPLPKRKRLTRPEVMGSYFLGSSGPEAMGGASGVTEGWTLGSSLVGGGVHSENSYVWWQNYRWGPEVVSEHVVRVRGKRRRRKVKDIGGCGGSQATQRLSPLLKRPVWNHGACPCLTAPHAISRWARWPCWPASTQLEQNESRVGFGVSSEEGRWDSLCFSQSRTIGTGKPRPWGCCQKAHSLTFCGGSTEWNQVFF